MVLAPAAVLLFPALGLASVWGALVFVALLAGAGLAAIPPSGPRPRVVAAVAAAVVLAGVALAGVGATVESVDARHPRLMSLVYGVDADTGTATWLSPYPVADPFIDHYVTGPARPWTQAFPVLHSPAYRSGPGRVVPVPTPTLRTVGVTPGTGDRRVTLTLAADSPAATKLALYVDTRAAAVVSARVAGQPVPGGQNRRAGDAYRWGFTFVGPTTEGVQVDLTLSGTAPVRVLVMAITPGLPAPAMDQPMPATLTGAISGAVQTLATRTAVV
jgi:hypothetical protein